MVLLPYWTKNFYTNDIATVGTIAVVGKIINQKTNYFKFESN